MRMNVRLGCDEITQGLADFLDEALPPGRRKRFEHHLATCAPCAHHFQQLLHTLQRLASLPREPMPAPLRAHLLRAHQSRQSA
jgi:anti-sigma factor RsiW